MTIFGTRPEAVKMAPVIARLRESPDVRPVVVVTAQHREMLDQVLRLFGITPDRDLDVMRHEQSLFDITSRTLERLDPVLADLRPAMVLVQGDASSTFLGALAAFYHRIPVGHVEAGLRTHDKYRPFPEEINRRLTSVLADLHFAPTAQARANLLQDGIAADAILVTGNTVIDALFDVARRPDVEPPPGLPPMDGKRMLLVTTHRRENWGEPLRQIYVALLDLLDRFPDAEVVFSVHRNPAVRRVAVEMLGGHARVHLIEPPDYGPWVRLMGMAYLILTDSGGIQEEAPALGTPVLVAREVTERPEGVVAGTVEVVGTSRERIVERAGRLLADPDARAAMARARNPYGDGHASERIVAALRRWFGLTSERPQEFVA
ncbi:MAG: UDP-N-acetylglucosamine 2-epimerase (non-hydrolyzing) [Armatimonadetes bacterium]|nr:UDP-N-acetylglucosamine 2-epimerase (non-hydrolyzing) [Armatimonadota bacterium]